MIAPSSRYRTIALSIAIAIFAGVGCKSGRPLHTSQGNGPDPNLLNDDGTSRNSGTTVCADPLLANPSKLEIVYFDFDTATLTDEARAVLKANAAALKHSPRLHIQLAGHCDERGTQAYNLALGERRAQAVRDYLTQLGVPAANLVTISYGKEKPADTGSGEAAWSKNRRCEFLGN